MKKILFVCVAMVMAAGVISCTQQTKPIKPAVVNEPSTLTKDAENIKLAEAYADSIFVRMDIYVIKYTSATTEKAKKAALKEFDRTSKRHQNKLDSLYKLLTPDAAKQLTSYRQTLLDKVQANKFTKDFYDKFYEEYKKEGITIDLHFPA